MNVYADGVSYADGPFVGFPNSTCTPTAPTFGRRRIIRPSATCVFPVVLEDKTEKYVSVRLGSSYFIMM